MESFRKLIFPADQSKFVVRTAMQLLHVATNGVLGAFRIKDHVEIRKPLLIELHPSVAALMN